MHQRYTVYSQNKYQRYSDLQYLINKHLLQTYPLLLHHLRLTLVFILVSTGIVPYGFVGHVMSEYLVLLDWSLGKSLSEVLYVFHFATFASVSGESFACVQSELVKSLSRSLLICVHSSARILASFVVSSPTKCD